MIKNTDEILKEAFDNSGVPDDAVSLFMAHDKPIYDAVKQAIRQAQIEAIEECAEEVKNAVQNDTLMGDRYELGERAKESILQLKNQVK